MGSFSDYPVIADTAQDGFVFGTITPLTGERQTGAGFLQGPDGSRAVLQWELSDSPFIMRLEGPTDDGWGVYRVGFLRPAATVADLIYNLSQLLPKLQILHTRLRGTGH